MSVLYYTAVALITVFLVLQLVAASRANRLGLWLLTIVFFIYFVYSSTVELELSREYYRSFFDVREGYLAAAVWLLLLVVVCVRWGYSRQQSIRESPRAVRLISYRQALILSVAGLVAACIQFYLAGGVEAVWSRRPEAFQWAGTIRTSATEYRFSVTRLPRLAESRESSCRLRSPYRRRLRRLRGR